jgi:nitric oxide reductase
MLGVPAKDIAYLTEMNTVRTNGSSTAAAAQDANRLALGPYVATICAS